MTSNQSLPRARLPTSGGMPARDRSTRSFIELGAPAVDMALQGGLARAALHEVYAATEADAPAAAGFALALIRRTGRRRAFVWVRQDFLDVETGFPNPPGLAEWGLDPAAIVRVRARDAPAALQAGLEAARHASGGVALIELWGETRAFDLTASRRLALAAKNSGVTVLMTLSAAEPRPTAAETRWLVGAAPSRALPANAPGNPAFTVRLLRHRGGVAGLEWRLEWNRDAGCLEDRTALAADASQPGANAPLPRALVPLSPDRPRAPADERQRLRGVG